MAMTDTSKIREEVDATPLWYHTLELPGDIVTPGWFDLRPIVDRMPWPDVRGKRCLDVGTYDGFLAFELEKRGASEVVATDISDHTQWDWPIESRQRGPDYLALVAGPEKGVGFRIAKEVLGSQVEKIEINVYDLSPERLGTFDVVVCGSLLLHLRDPMRALAAVRSVTGERFLSAEQIDLPLTLLQPRRPATFFPGGGSVMQWSVPNVTAHVRMLAASGFAIERRRRPYAIPYGAAHAARPRGVRAVVRQTLERAIAGGTGVPHAAVLARAV
jgi:tRNA (mo5U34)-methyltransferase